MPKSKMERVTVTLDKGDLDKLDKLARGLGIGRSAAVRMAVLQLLKTLKQ